MLVLLLGYQACLFTVSSHMNWNASPHHIVTWPEIRVPLNSWDLKIPVEVSRCIIRDNSGFVHINIRIFMASLQKWLSRVHCNSDSNSDAQCTRFRSFSICHNVLKAIHNELTIGIMSLSLGAVAWHSDKKYFLLIFALGLFFFPAPIHHIKGYFISLTQSIFNLKV